MEEKIENLKEKLRHYDTRDLLGMISIHFMYFVGPNEDVGSQTDLLSQTTLISPQKQYLYLAGLLMSTDDLSEGKIHNDHSHFENIENDVQEITLQYAKNFFDFDIDLKNGNANSETIKHNLVTFDAFTSYFDTAILRYEEQTVRLIRQLYQSFDHELNLLSGLSIDDYLNFYFFIVKTFKERLETPKATIQDAIYSLNGKGGPSREALFDSIDAMNTVTLDEIIAKFGKSKATILTSLFCIHRKERDFKYYNGKNPFVKHPLCWIDNSRIFIVHPQFLLNAIYDHITTTLENPDNSFSEKYKSTKAHNVENLFLSCLKNAFGTSALYHSSVCEKKGTNEHDHLIEIGNYIIIAEDKASKVREPLFNPEKAYKRIYDHFKSASGIGGAYKQAIILKKFIESHDSVTLFEDMTRPFTIENISQKTILPIVLTLNQFGGLAINTSEIIEKESNQPYPWVCNLHDFQDILEMNQYLEKGPEAFLNYIIWRINNHKRIISSDELDILETYYLDYETLSKNNDALLYFPPNGPNLMDKIYFGKKGFYYDHPLVSKPIKRIKIGVNDPCPCGSGKKFKKCCRGNGMYD